MKSEIIQNFIDNFNNEFGEYLWPMPDRNLDPGSQSIKFLNVYLPTKKYSDWDIHCYLKPEYRKEEIIRKIELYIFSYHGLLNQAIFICKSSNLSGVWQHINNMDALQIMAFMENESDAPFFDFTLFGVGKELIKSMYSVISDEGSIYWSFLTAWRKLKNDDQQKYLSISTNYVVPLLAPRIETKSFLTDPSKFFKEKLKAKGYEKIVKFLFD